MNKNQPTTMQAWIEREFAICGVLAAGGGRRDGHVFSSFASGELVLAGNEDVWRGVAETVAVLQSKGAPAGELLWGFEHAVLCTVQRDDGVWLGVFTVPNLKD
ncbi:MAG TPA: hypothetical protein VNT99_17975, partial [Methylomirabilota bacterium]|nr:hypothetical protein [Methylomirabilota bacterium]